MAIAFNSCGVNDFALLTAPAPAEGEVFDDDGKSSGATARKASRTKRSAFSLNFFGESARTTRNDFECMVMRVVCRLFGFQGWSVAAAQRSSLVVKQK